MEEEQRQSDLEVLRSGISLQPGKRYVIKISVQGHRVRSPDLLFRKGGAILTPVPSGNTVVTSYLSPLVRVFLFQKDNQGYGLTLFGQADGSGGTSLNQTLTEDRANGVLALMESDRDAWVSLADDKGKIMDHQALLKGMATLRGWPCDPGEVDDISGPKTKSGIRGFQTTYNQERDSDLAADGIIGPQTLGALFDEQTLLIDTRLEERGGSREALAFLDDSNKVVPCGEQWSGDSRGGGGSPESERRVDLLLLPALSPPELPGDPPGSTVYGVIDLAPLSADLDEETVEGRELPWIVEVDIEEEEEPIDEVRIEAHDGSYDETSLRAGATEQGDILQFGFPEGNEGEYAVYVRSKDFEYCVLKSVKFPPEERTVDDTPIEPDRPFEKVVGSDRSSLMEDAMCEE